MNKKFIPIIILGILIAALLGGSVAYNNLSPKYVPVQPGVVMPSFGQGDTVESTISEDTNASESAGDSTNSDEHPTVPAPDFVMLNAAEEEVHLSDYFGNPIILNFWASWCPPCQGEMPHFEDAYRDFGDEITFLMVDLTDGDRETIDRAHALIDENGYTFPIFFDYLLEGGNTYGTYSIPMTFFIDPDGNVLTYYPGAMSKEILYRIINELMLP